MAAKKTTKLRPWTKEDVRMLKTLAREKTKTSVIARKLKRTPGRLISSRQNRVLPLAGVGRRGREFFKVVIAEALGTAQSGSAIGQ